MKSEKFAILICLIISACTPLNNGVGVPDLKLSPSESATSINFETPNITNTIQPILTRVPSKTLEPITTATLTPDIAALRKQGVVDPWIIATLGTRGKPIWDAEPILFSPDSKLLASSSDNVISLWDASTFKDLFKFHINGYWAKKFSFSSDSRFLASVVTNGDKTHLFIWDVTNGEKIESLELESAILAKDSENPYHIVVDAIGFIPKSNRLVVASGNTIRIIDVLKQGEPVTLKLGQDMFASEISFPNDGRLIYVLMEWWQGHGFPSEWKTKHVVQIWDTNTHSLRRTLDYPAVEWANEFMSLHESFLIKRTPQKMTLEMINLENDKVLQLPYRQGTAFWQGWEYLTTDNKFITFMRYYGYFKEEDKGIEFWTTDTWRNIYTLKPEFFKLSEPVDELGADRGQLAISPDNSLLAITYAGQVFVYDIRLITAP